MKNRKILLFILICILCTSLSLFFACNKAGNDEVSLVCESLTLKVGDEYRLYTSDGILYTTYVSDNEDVCSVTSAGLLRAKKEGEANITVKVNTKTLTCVVTVINSIEQDSTAYVKINAPKILKVNNKCTINYEIFDNNGVSSEVVWTIDGDCVEYTMVDNQVSMEGIKKGFCTIKATLGNFETSVKVKVYDDSCVLQSPREKIEGLDIYWDEVQNAVSYKVTVNRGASWETTTSTNCHLDDFVNPIDVAVVAVADEDSEYVDSQFSFYSKNLDINEIKSATDSNSTLMDDLVTLQYSGSENEYILFNIYGEFKSILKIGDNDQIFNDTAVVFDVYAQNISQVTFVTESEQGLKTMSTFEIGTVKTEVGYLLNGYKDKCYVLATDDVFISNIRLKYRPIDYYYSQCFLKMVECSKEFDSIENFTYIKENLRYLCKEEYSKFISTISQPLKDKLFDLEVIGAKAETNGLISSDATFEKSYDYDYVDIVNGNCSSILLTGTNNHADINYDGLLPETDPGFDYYEWRIYSSVHVPEVLIGNAHVELMEGWNTVVIDWEILNPTDVAARRFYNMVQMSPNTVWFSLGNLVGKNFNHESDITAFGTIVNVDDFSSYNATISFSNSPQYIDAENGNTVAIVVKSTSNIDMSLMYGTILPEEDSYDYYEWRIWASRACTMQFFGGNSAVSLNAGWNTVRFEDLTKLSANEAQFYLFGNVGELEFSIGNLVGKNLESDVTILGTVVGTKDFSSYNAIITLSNDSKYVDAENGNTVAIVVKSTSNIDMSLTYGTILPEEDSYDYYEWRIWASRACTMQFFGGNSAVSLNAGWNTVRFEDLTKLSANEAQFYLYNGVGELEFSLGNLIGKNNEPGSGGTTEGGVSDGSEGTWSDRF